MNIGERVREARETLGYTQDELAGELRSAGLELDRYAIIGMENGKRSVKAEELYGLARVLDRPLVYFLQQEPAAQTIAVAHRGSPAEQREAIRAQLHLQRWLDDYAEVAQLVDPEFGSTLAQSVVTPPTRGRMIERACAAARQQRQRMSLGSDPIPELRRIVEEAIGLPVFGDSVPDAKFWGLLVTRHRASHSERPPWAIFVNTRLGAAFCRFTVGHELGHLILKLAGEDYTPDVFYITDPAGPAKEIFANVFAAEFLAPLDGLRQCDAENIDESQPDSIMALAVRFGVSFQMMTWRLADLRCFDKAAAKELIDSVSPTRLPSFKWGRQEFDGLSPRFCEYVVRAYMKGLLPEGRCAEMLGKTTLEFVEMVEEISAECRPEAAFSAAS